MNIDEDLHKLYHLQEASCPVEQSSATSPLMACPSLPAMIGIDSWQNEEIYLENKTTV